MKKVMLVLGLVYIIFLTGNAGATLYNFQPGDSDLEDLDHHYNYVWGIEWSVPGGERISGVSLTFNDIRNWDRNDNVLYVHLLDDADAGVVTEWDNQAGGDNFLGQGIELFTWHNLSHNAQDLTYSLSNDEIIFLAASVADGDAGFAFDPDCHFFNNGVSLLISTSSDTHTTSGSVPEPDMLLLQVAGLVGYVVYRRKRQ